jgi:hypothetical protein
MTLEHISQFTEAIKSARHKSAMQPALWLCLIVTTPALGFAIRSQGPAQGVLFAFAAVPVLLFVGAYIYFMCTDPDRLHSEEYQLRDRALDIVERKGGDFAISPKDLVSMTNPYPEPRKALPGGKGPSS